MCVWRLTLQTLIHHRRWWSAADDWSRCPEEEGLWRPTRPTSRWCATRRWRGSRVSRWRATHWWCSCECCGRSRRRSASDSAENRTGSMRCRCRTSSGRCRLVPSATDRPSAAAHGSGRNQASVRRPCIHAQTSQVPKAKVTKHLLTASDGEKLTEKLTANISGIFFQLNHQFNYRINAV